MSVCPYLHIPPWWLDGLSSYFVHDQVVWAADAHNVEFGSAANLISYGHVFIHLDCFLDYNMKLEMPVWRKTVFQTISEVIALSKLGQGHDLKIPIFDHWRHPNSFSGITCNFAAWPWSQGQMKKLLLKGPPRLIYMWFTTFFSVTLRN